MIQMMQYTKDNTGMYSLKKVTILQINIFYSILNAHCKITLVLNIMCVFILWEVNKTNTKCGTNVAQMWHQIQQIKAISKK